MPAPELTSQQRPSDRERRGCRRYGLEVEVRYTVRSGRRPAEYGHGTSCNMSSSGLLIRTANRLDPGSAVVAALEWPVPASDGSRQSLVVTGLVVRTSEEHTALAISGHRFASSQEAGSLESDTGATSSLAASGAWRRGGARRRPVVRMNPMVLVVESREVHDIIRAMLGRYGCNVRYADTETVLEILHQRDQRVGLLIAERIEPFRAFAGQVPMIQTSEENAPSSWEGGRMIVLKKPLLYRSLLAAVFSLWQVPLI